jgi:hypothetical protein
MLNRRNTILLQDICHLMQLILYFLAFKTVGLHIMLFWAVTLFRTCNNLLETHAASIFSVKMSEDFDPLMGKTRPSKTLVPTYNTTWHHNSKRLRCELSNTT